MLDTDVSGGRGKLAVLTDGTEEDDNDNDNDTLSPTKVRFRCIQIIVLRIWHLILILTRSVATARSCTAVLSLADCKYISPVDSDETEH